MTSKRKPSKKRDPNAIDARGPSHDDAATRKAGIVLRPTVQAASTIKEYGKTFGELDITSLIYSLGEQAKASSEGDMSRAEGMLTAQAHTLDAIFNNLATKASNAEYLKNLDVFMKIALRAQSQCRATWEALSAIKNPPVMGYVKQANIAHGPQQVNNSASDDTPRTRENQNSQNKLMEKKDDERLDIGTTSTAGQADPAMATLGEVDGAKNAGG
jgi:hypothetical protein